MRFRVQKGMRRFEGVGMYFKVYTPLDVPVTRRVACVCSPISDAASFDSLCRELAKNGCLCVTVELPGFGHTPVKAPQDNRSRAKLVWGVLDEIEISRGEDEGKWHLFGHGSGAGVVLLMTTLYPESVISRVLISPVTHIFGYKKRTFRLSGLTRWYYLRKYEYFEAHTRRALDKIRELYGPRLKRERGEELCKNFFRKGRGQILLEMLEKGYYLPDEVYETDRPVMTLMGDEDPMGRELFDRLFSALSGVKVREIHPINTRHMCMETDWSVVKDWVKGWLDYTEGKVKQPGR